MISGSIFANDHETRLVDFNGMHSVFREFATTLLTELVCSYRRVSLLLLYNSGIKFCYECVFSPKLISLVSTLIL